MGGAERGTFEMCSSSALALLAAASLTASSCGFVDSITANGDVRTESRPVPTFSSVALEGSGTLRIRQGAQDVEITADSNVLPYIETMVTGPRLTIGLKPFTTLWGNPTLVYEISVPSLDGVTLSGSADASVGSFAGGSFDARISGSGSLGAVLAYNHISFLGSGSGNASFGGSAAETYVSISGSGSLSARDLTTVKAVVNISGSGGVDIRAVDSLDATIYGSGRLRYWGSPALSQNVLGSGRVYRAGN